MFKFRCLCTWDDVVLLENLNKGCPISTLLEERLLEEDATTDVCSDTCFLIQREEKLTVIPPVGLVIGCH